MSVVVSSMFCEISPAEMGRGQKILSSWSKVSEKISLDTKNKIGRLYLKHVLNLEDEVVESIYAMSENPQLVNVDARQKLVDAKSSIPFQSEGLHFFWGALNEVAPEFLKDADKALFERWGTIGEVFDLLWHLSKAEDINHYSLFINELLSF